MRNHRHTRATPTSMSDDIADARARHRGAFRTPQRLDVRLHDFFLADLSRTHPGSSRTSGMGSRPGSLPRHGNRCQHLRVEHVADVLAADVDLHKVDLACEGVVAIRVLLADR